MSEYTPFKMKGSPMKRNFGIGSPMRNEEGDEYGKVLDAINPNWSKKELRQYVLKQNKDASGHSKKASDRSRIAMNAAIKNWRAKQDKTKTDVTEKDVTEKVEEKVIAKPTAGEKKRYYYADSEHFVPSSQGGYQPLSAEREKEIEDYISFHTAEGKKVDPEGKAPKNVRYVDKTKEKQTKVYKAEAGKPKGKILED